MKPNYGQNGVILELAYRKRPEASKASYAKKAKAAACIFSALCAFYYAAARLG
jgi:hypothetical protein